MAKQNPTLYSVAKTFFWFAIVSLVLTACLVGIVYEDYRRDWKDYQKKFTALKLEKIKLEISAADQNIDKAEVARLTQEIKAAEVSAASNGAQSSRLEKELFALETRLTKAKDNYQTLKQFLDSDRYFYEEYTEKKDVRAQSYGKKMRELSPRVAKAKADQDALQKEVDAKTAELASFAEKRKNLQRDLDKVLAEKTRLEKRAERSQPSLAKDVLNAPMLDFVAPTLRVQQIVLDNLQDDYHFAKVQKVDRCTTCHLGIDQKGFEDAPQPFRTHPKLELYLGSASAHPVEKVGCTVCHGGNGHSIDFVRAAHTPKNEEQEKEWVKKYRWHELEKWEHKMLPAANIEASCVKCHQGVVEVPKADRLNKGRKLAETMGCFNCHKIKGYEDRWKVGPDLQHLNGKVSEEWVSKWLDDPTFFRPGTSMPKVFHLSNTSSPEDRLRNNAAISSIAAYLMKNSQPAELLTPPVPGDAVKGEKLIKTLGCLACHSGAGVAASEFGPALTGLGSKTSAEWVYSWIKDPKRMSSATRMPNLRLSDQEASDITSYLISQRHEEFDKKEPIKAEPAVIDEMISVNLQGTMSAREAADEMAKMSSDDKIQYLGKKSIAHQGCFTCHTIKGFEDMKPIGAELSNEGLKDIHQFDFGFSDIPRTRQSFISQKLKEPRVFDHNKVKSYYEKLRMPQFNFTDEENEALTTFVLSLTEEQIPLEMQKRLSSEDAATEKGRLLVSKLNCTGCHTLDGHVGTIRAITEDSGQMPPILDGEGAKVQERWLHDFLKAPAPIRPWLTYRMPTFGFDESELTTLNLYFNHLSHQEVSFGGLQIPDATPENLAAGKQLFDMFQCVKCHQITQESAAMGSSFLAPDLTLTKTRLKPAWVHAWVEDPQKLEEGTMMPTFFSEGQSPATEILGGDAKKQVDAIRDYLYRYENAAPAETKS